MPRAQKVTFSPRVMVWGRNPRDNCTRSDKSSHYSKKMNVNSDYYIHDILEKEVKPAFSRMQTSTDLMQQSCFPATVKECFSRMALVRIRQRLQSPGRMQILNTTFHRRTGRLIHRICLRLRTFGLWHYGNNPPFMPTPSLSHCKH